ncbi:MAG: cyclopropane-fatty-acyl-phospholipid synthase family protein [Hyphomicrobiaceae bacterium]
MTIRQKAFNLAERAPVPDVLVRLAIEQLVSRTSRLLARADRCSTARFAEDLARLPIAIHTDVANAQHYEMPASFYELVLGSQRKYSCCYFDSPRATLGDAEERALELTGEHADLADGQTILELGCGWGSLSLWMARKYPGANIVAVSNSRSQRVFIEQRVREQSLANLSVESADMNEFRTKQQFERIVSVEMFEHMSNWRELLGRARSWIAPGGRMFMHIFSHRTTPYFFDHSNEDDWIAQHFFTGGVMPSHDLIRCYSDHFEVEKEWHWDGSHYARTADRWLARFDANAEAVARIFDAVYGSQSKLWQRRWRLFFLATSGLFGFKQGHEWGVSHFLLKPTNR